MSTYEKELFDVIKEKIWDHLENCEDCEGFSCFENPLNFRETIRCSCGFSFEYSLIDVVKSPSYHYRINDNLEKMLNGDNLEQIKAHIKKKRMEDLKPVHERTRDLMSRVNPEAFLFGDNTIPEVEDKNPLSGVEL